MTIKPLSDRVLIEPLPFEEKTKAGIILPESAEKEGPKQGRVVAIGPGKKDNDNKVIPVSLKPGDKVLFIKHEYESDNEIKVDGKDYLIVREEDILAIIE